MNTMNTHTRQWLGAAACVFSLTGQAQEVEAPASWWDGRVQVNTFGTLGVSRLSIAGAHLRSEATSTSGIGPEWTGAYDSRLGLQVAAQISPDLGLTWQGLLRRQNKGGFGVDTQWAYANWQITPQWEVKLGRYMSPLYLVSDQRMVGLSQPWVRAPHEVYGLLGNVDSLDGLWLRRRLPLGDETLMVDLYHARHREDRGSFSVNHEPLTGLSLRLSDTRWTWHAMVARARTRIELDPASGVAQALALLSEPALGGNPVAAQDYDFRRIDPLHFYSAGVRYEAAPWLVMAEVAQLRSSNRALPGSTGAYLTVGHSWGPWLGYVTLAQLRGLNPGTETRFSGAVDASVVQPFLQALRESGQTTLGVGTRWDMARGLALKAQVDHVTPRTDGRGGLFLESPLPNGHRSAWLYSVVLDWAY